MKSRKFSSFFSVALLFVLVLGMKVTVGWAQSRRLPPTTNEKKNKRPGTSKEGEKQDEPLPPDLIGRPQDIEQQKIRANHYRPEEG
jgi:hypothetical protein